jgi:hypothetical protein
VDERLKVQARLTEIEEKIQDLGVSLGEFNAENEFCTVKLTLAEIEPPLSLTGAARAMGALFWALEHFIFLAAGLASSARFCSLAPRPRRRSNRKSVAETVRQLRNPALSLTKSL